MRLFLFLLILCVGVPALILALTRLSYLIVPASIEAAIVRTFVWTCAHAMFVAFRMTWWAWSLVEKHERLAPLAERLDTLAQEVLSPLRFHVTARVFGEVCDPCADRAPGWWEFEIDCGDHRCGTCDACTTGCVSWPAVGSARS